MKARFRVTFKDGTIEELEAEGADQAKAEAKNRRFREVDPGGSSTVADLRASARTQVQSVVELVAGAAGYVLLVLTAALGYWLERTVSQATDGVLTAGVLMLVSAKGTAIGATLAALTAVSGDSLAVPHFPEPKKAWLLQVWADVQVAGTLRIRSPKMHDNVNGIRIDTTVSDLLPLLPWGPRQNIYSGDTMIVELAGSAVAGDEEFVCMLQYFEELSAQHAKLLTAEQVLSRMRDLLTVENTIATGTTGIYTGAEAINAEIDQFQHNDEYAILGFKTDVECAAVRWRAPDFANVGVAGPGIDSDPDILASWFLDLSRGYNLPLVPVFNAANKASVLIDALQDENGADVTVTTYLARLMKG